MSCVTGANKTIIRLYRNPGSVAGREKKVMSNDKNAQLCIYCCIAVLLSAQCIVVLI